jgi:hypothetical protein
VPRCLPRAGVRRVRVGGDPPQPRARRNDGGGACEPSRPAEPAGLSRHLRVPGLRDPGCALRARGDCAWAHGSLRFAAKNGLTPATSAPGPARGRARRRSASSSCSRRASRRSAAASATACVLVSSQPKRATLLIAAGRALSN